MGLMQLNHFPQGLLVNYLIRTRLLQCPPDAFQCLNFTWVLLSNGSLDNEHPFVNISAYSRLSSGLLNCAQSDNYKQNWYSVVCLTHAHMHASKHARVTCTVTDSILIGLLCIHITQREGALCKIFPFSVNSHYIATIMTIILLSMHSLT